MPKRYALTDVQGMIVAFYSDDIASDIPAEAIELTDEQWLDWLANPTRRKWSGTAVIEIEDTNTRTDPPLTRLYKSEVWRRATDAEAEQLDAALAAAPVRLRRLWADSTVLDTASEDWPLLRDPVVQLLGAARAAELLAPTF